MMKTVKPANLEGCDFFECLGKRLMAYRRMKPLQLVCLLPQLWPEDLSYDGIPALSETSKVKNISDYEKAFRIRKKLEKERERENFDLPNEKRNVQACQFQLGEVLRKTEQVCRKLTTLWEPSPWTAVKTEEDIITVSKNGATATRHASFLKPFKSDSSISDGEVSDEQNESEHTILSKEQQSSQLCKSSQHNDEQQNSKDCNSLPSTPLAHRVHHRSVKRRVDYR